MLREADLVLIRHSDGVQHLTLNRPDKRNAMSRALIHALKAAFEACDADPAVRVVVLDGAGAGFCAGADLTETGAIATEDGASAHANLIASLLMTPRTLSKPVIAQVHGFALGAGCGLALACDSIVCANDARLGYPEMARGVLPALVVPLLVRDVGRKAAFEFLSAGRAIDAARASAMGLARPVAPAELASSTSRLAAELAQQPPHLMAALKALINSAEDLPLAEAMQHAFTANVASKLGRPIGGPAA